MLLVKDAWLSVSRRVSESVVLLLIMTVIFAALMAEAGVRSSMQALRKNVSRRVSAGFVVRPGGGELSHSCPRRIPSTPTWHPAGNSPPGRGSPEAHYLVSAVVAMIPMLRLKPNQILSKMS